VSIKSYGFFMHLILVTFGLRLSGKAARILEHDTSYLFADILRILLLMVANILEITCLRDS
jgi:hypothetical protein